jgi:hypothetical protein
VAPNIVVCTDPDAIYHIHGVRSGYTKAEWYNIARISPNSDNIMSMIETEQRRERKKYIMPAVRIDFILWCTPNGLLMVRPLSTRAGGSMLSRRALTSHSRHGST